MVGINHLSGRMGVLVNSRFDDEKELANGVYTITFYRNSNNISMELNVQKGADSVTNPEGNSIPEIDSVRYNSNNEVVISRIQHSSIAQTSWILNESQLSYLFENS